MKLFQLTRNERLGLVGTILIFSVLLVIKYYDSRIDFELVQANLEKIEATNKQVDDSKKKSVLSEVKEKSAKISTIKIKPFEQFDPNHVDLDYWQSLGFPNEISSRIFKFIHSGKSLEKANELALVYGMKKSWLDQIKDSLVFDRKKIDLNSVSKEGLIELKGVGEKLAKRIVKFREALGGFHSIDQLSQVYGLDSSVVMNNAQVLSLNQSHEKIDLLSTGLKQMASHPYLHEQQAEEIIRIRSVNSKIDSAQLRNIFTTQEWVKIKPYLQWSH